MESEVFVHPAGLCESTNVAGGTRVWAYAHVLPGAKIGRNCNICDHVFIENDVEIGDDVTVKCGVQLWDGLRVGNRVFIGPNATFANDRYPRSRQRPATFLPTIVEDDVSIGSNATILPGIRVGRGAMIGAGSVVTRDVPPFARLVGNPARIIGYQNVDTTINRTQHADLLGGDGAGVEIGSRVELGVGKCFVERLPHFEDLRGGLTPLELGKGLPFHPARIFMVYGVSSSHVRGEHAHYECEQFLVAANGSLSVLVDDGSRRVEVRLADRMTGLYLAPKVWGVQYKFSADCVLMVAASAPYRSEDYIRDYESFLRVVAGGSAP